MATPAQMSKLKNKNKKSSTDAKIAKKQKRREEKEKKKLKKEKKEKKKELKRIEKKAKKAEKKAKKAAEAERLAQLEAERLRKAQKEAERDAKIKRKQEKKMLKKLEKRKRKDKESKSKKSKTADPASIETKTADSVSIEPKTTVSVSTERTPVTVTFKAPLPSRTVTNTSASVPNTSTSMSTSTATITPPTSVSSTPISKAPVAIRKPGSNRAAVNPCINPIYTAPTTVNSTQNLDSFIIPGVNDTEESRQLVRVFASKWMGFPKLKELERETGLQYRKGRFSLEEQALAEKFTNKFCKDQNMTLDKFKSIFFDQMGAASPPGQRLSDFFVSITAHFGGRPVVALYDFLKRKYHPGNHRGAWTDEDDQALIEEFRKHGPKWTTIGKELNRHPLNVRDRYNLKFKHMHKHSGPWTREEDECLVDAMKESQERSGTIAWLWISEERVKTRTPLQCLSHWIQTRGPLKTQNMPKPQPQQPQSQQQKVTKPKTTTIKLSWNGWKEDEDYLLIYAILTETGSDAVSDELIDWRSLKIPEIPSNRHNPDLFFRRWNHLKAQAKIADLPDLCLKDQVNSIKKYLVNLSKSPAYIFSEDEEEILDIQLEA